MKYALSLGMSVLALSGCASAPASSPTTPAPASSAAPVEEAPTPGEEEEAAPEPPKQSSAEAWAEKRSREEAAAAPPSSTDAMAADPLAIGDAMESAVTTKIELTPARQLRTKSVRDLEDGRKIAEKAETYDEAVKKLVVRLGKPTWVEDGKKHVWVVRDSTHCYRLALGGDGSIETETVTPNDWRMLSALSQQNACTGAVKNGIPGMKH
ncbi:MAG: hypothetical protein BGO98_13245 [Myxococcales bacterium 68-20]|nr:hypothetical protein [Myxococcales bacterium]OJY17110.1 MAG: hypothetical protein BGO98_13245 [Myxococcales bacterium 68-20]